MTAAAPSPFCNNLRKDDVVLHGPLTNWRGNPAKGRRAVVAMQPRETSTNVAVIFDGTESVRYVPVQDLRLIVDGKPEDVPPYNGELPGDKPRAPAELKSDMKDAELLALAAMAHVDAVTMAGDNRACEMRGQGEGPMWRYGTGYPTATTALFRELQKRNLIL